MITHATDLVLQQAGHTEGGLAMLPHVGMLVITGGAFLLGFGVLERETRAEGAGSDLAHAELRWPMIWLLFVASMAHVPMIPDHLEEAPYMGVLFVLFSVASFALAALLALRPTEAWYDAAGLLCLAAIAAYALSRSVALPQLADDVGHWTEPLGIVSILAEAGAVLVALMARRDQLAAPTRS